MPINPETYKQQREMVNSRPPEIPAVKVYVLSQVEQEKAFFTSLRTLPDRLKLAPWQDSASDEAILLEALDRKIVLDQMPLQLNDLIMARKSAVALRGRENVIKRYSQIFSSPQNGVFVEYEFESGEGRFIHTLSPSDFYEVMFSRNQYAIPPEVQAKLKNNRYAIAGASVGGMVAWLFLMSGAQNLTIADGGPLKLHSFNRLNFAQTNDLGTNKAIAFAKQAYRYFPFINLEITNTNLSTPQQMSDFVKGASVLVEAVDSLQNKEDIQLSGLSENITVYAPTDLGLGGALLQILTSKTGPFLGHLSSEQSALLHRSNLSLTNRTSLAMQIIGAENIPPRMLAAVMKGSQKDLSYWTQPAVAAYLSANMTVVAEILRLSGEELKTSSRLDLPDILSAA